MSVDVCVEDTRTVSVSCPANTERLARSSFLPDGTQLRPVLISCLWTKGQQQPLYRLKGPRIMADGSQGRSIDAVIYPGHPVPVWILELTEPHRPAWAALDTTEGLQR